MLKVNRPTLFILSAALYICGCSESPSDAEGNLPAVADRLPAVADRLPAVADRLPCSAEPTQGSTRTKNDTQVNQIIDYLKESEIVGAKLVSSRTLSSKIKFADGGKAVFKPFLKGDRRASREVAVFRLADALGVDTVPISTVRKASLYQLVEHIKYRDPTEAEMLEKRAAVDDEGYVRGAVIQWIDELDPDGYESLGGKPALMKLVSRAKPLSSEEQGLAAHVSAMILLDYLVGNWDRFSGGNIFLNETGGLVLLDHNGTFAPWSDRQRERMVKLLARTERFSRSLFERTRELNRKKIEEILSQETGHLESRLISEEEVTLLLERRDSIITHIQKLIDRSGSEAVLPFH